VAKTLKNRTRYIQFVELEGEENVKVEETDLRGF